MEDELTDDDINKLNKTLAVLQQDMQDVIDDITNENYEHAVEVAQSAMDHTECSVCRDNFTLIGADVIKTKMLCKLGDEKCKSQRTESIEFVKKVKDTFLPVATEKNIANQRSVAEGGENVYTKANNYKADVSPTEQKITPLNAPLVLLDDIAREFMK